MDADFDTDLGSWPFIYEGWERSFRNWLKIRIFKEQLQFWKQYGKMEYVEILELSTQDDQKLPETYNIFQKCKEIKQLSCES